MSKKFKNQNDGDLAGVLYNRGTANVRKGNLSEAIEDFTKAIGININDPVAYYNRAVAYLGLKLYDEAWGNVNMVKEIERTDQVTVSGKQK